MTRAKPAPTLLEVPARIVRRLKAIATWESGSAADWQKWTLAALESHCDEMEWDHQCVEEHRRRTP